MRKCEICEYHFSKLNIHHINGNHKDNSDKNVILICSQCHAAIHLGFNDKEYSLNHPRRKVRALRSYNTNNNLKTKLRRLRIVWLNNKEIEEKTYE